MKCQRFLGFMLCFYNSVLFLNDRGVFRKEKTLEFQCQINQEIG